MPTAAGHRWEENPLENRLQANLSGLSIYQPGNKRGQVEVPRFPGFYACFLEITFSAVAQVPKILWFWYSRSGLVVVLTSGAQEFLWTHNRSTTDGTKVGVRGEKGSG
jgi:hypothetical protein